MNRMNIYRTHSQSNVENIGFLSVAEFNIDIEQFIMHY